MTYVFDGLMFAQVIMVGTSNKTAHSPEPIVEGSGVAEAEDQPVISISVDGRGHG